MLNYEVTSYAVAIESMQEVMMDQIVKLIDQNQLRIIQQNNSSNMGLLRCTDKGWLNTVLGIKYDFQFESAKFVLTFNGNVIKNSDGDDDFYIHYDRNPDESFGELLDTIKTTLS
jgi:hypothetical protein